MQLLIVKWVYQLPGIAIRAGGAKQPVNISVKYNRNKNTGQQED